MNGDVSTPKNSYHIKQLQLQSPFPVPNSTHKGGRLFIGPKDGESQPQLPDPLVDLPAWGWGPLSVCEKKPILKAHNYPFSFHK